MVIFLIIFICSILAIYRINYFKKQEINQTFIVIYFLFKLFVGCIFILIYTYYYEDRKTGDIYKFFDSALKIKNLCGDDLASYLKILFGTYSENEKTVNNILSNIDFWTLGDDVNLVNDSRIVVRYNMVMLWISNGNIYIHLIPVTLFTIAGQLGIYRFLTNHLKHSRSVIFIAVFFLPSFIFWSSGILKEAFLIGFIGIALHLFQNLLDNNRKILTSLVFIISLIGIFYSKFYVVFALFPMLFTIWIYHIFNQKKYAIMFLYIGIVSALGSIFLPHIIKESFDKITKKQKRFMDVAIGGIFIKNNGDTLRIPYEFNTRCEFYNNNKELSVKQNISVFKYDNLKDGTKVELDKDNTIRYEIIEYLTGANTYFHIPIFSGNFINRLKSSLIYILNAMFRPMFYEVKNIFQLLSAMENLVLIILIILWILSFRLHFEINEIAIISFVVMLAFIIGSTTPIPGAIVRYKIPFLPFLYSFILNKRSIDLINTIFKRVKIKISK